MKHLFLFFSDNNTGVINSKIEVIIKLISYHNIYQMKNIQESIRIMLIAYVLIYLK